MLLERFKNIQLVQFRKSGSLTQGDVSSMQSLSAPLESSEQALPPELTDLKNPQTAIPELARNIDALKVIEAHVRLQPTYHQLFCGDARQMESVETESVHLVVTSPPYWTLKKYNVGQGQLGEIKDYECFLAELEAVWRECHRVLVPGGRLVCVVGDICLSRRKNRGRHTVVPLHASIQECCRKIGFDNLAPIIWYKIANAVYEANGNGAGFLGKPYEPNAVIKNDIEFLLMERKPGGYRKPSVETRVMSVISQTEYQTWFRQIWTDIPGTSTRNHPAPFPLPLADRLIRMFSFVGDTVLDPFMGSGTTNVAAARAGRNSIGIEIDGQYFKHATSRLAHSADNLFSQTTIDIYD